MKIKAHELPDVYAILDGIPTDRIVFASDCTIAAAKTLKNQIDTVHKTNDLREIRTSTAETWLTLHPMFRSYLIEAEQAHSKTYGLQRYIKLNTSDRWSAIGYYAIRAVASSMWGKNRALFAPVGYSPLDGKTKRMAMSAKQRVLYRILRRMKWDHQRALDHVQNGALEERRVRDQAALLETKVQAEAQREKILQTLVAATAERPTWTAKTVNGKMVLSNG